MATDGVVRLDKPLAGAAKSQPVIDLQLGGDQGVLQYTRVLLHYVANGERKTCLRAAWRELCFGDPPRSLGLAIGAQLVLLISLSGEGELGITEVAVEGFLRTIDEVFGCCVSRDSDSDDEAVADVIRLLRKSVTVVVEPDAESDANSGAENDDAEDDDAGVAEGYGADVDNDHADDTGDY